MQEATKSELDNSRESVSSELLEPRWSVISFERREASGLSYFDAVKAITDLEKQNIAGLCIVSDEAASRIKG